MDSFWQRIIIFKLFNTIVFLSYMEFSYVIIKYLIYKYFVYIYIYKT